MRGVAFSIMHRLKKTGSSPTELTCLSFPGELNGIIWQLTVIRVKIQDSEDFDVLGSPDSGSSLEVKIGHLSLGGYKSRGCNTLRVSLTFDMATVLCDFCTFFGFLISFCA